RATDNDARDNPGIRENLAIEKRGDHRDQHADRGGQVSVACGFGRAESADSQNEKHRREEVGRANRDFESPSGDHLARGPAGSRNIWSMRSVTRNPPMTFTVPSTTAIKPITCETGVFALPRTSMAPTSTIP